MIDRSISDHAFDATLYDFEKAAMRISKDVFETPLLELKLDDRKVMLKAECLQSLGSFKIRAGANAIETAAPDSLKKGVITASAGNFGQGVAKAALTRGLPVHVIAPNTASSAKIEALYRLGAKVDTVSFDNWWDIMMTRSSGLDGFFIHPVEELSVIMGNGSIGLEIVSQFPEVDAVVVPVGGGGMISGIALAMKALGKTPLIIACEIESSTPLSSAKEAGNPIAVKRGVSWVDGIGSTSVLPKMWPLLNKLVDDVIVVSHSEAASSLRVLAQEAHLVSEGAGAVALAAALRPELSGKNIVSIISGGNIDFKTYSRILNGEDF